MEQIEKLKLNYAGYVARESNLKLNKRPTLWIPSEGKRKVGRPLTRWADEVVRVAGPEWTRKARNRKTWADMTTAYARMGGLGVDHNGDTPQRPVNDV